MNKVGLSMVLLSLVSGLYLSLGTIAFGPRDWLNLIFGSADPELSFIFWNLRVPRWICAGMVGGALGFSGAVFQILFRNPLADPYIMGVSGGAAVGAAAMVALGWTASIPLASLAGSIGVLFLLLAVTRAVSAREQSEMLLLVGVALSFLAHAMVLWIYYLAEPMDMMSMVGWMMGRVSEPRGVQLALLLGVVPIGIAVTLHFRRALFLLQLGDELAASSGLAVHRVRKLFFLGVGVLVSIAVSVCGPIGFVGLFVPHCARFLAPMALTSQLVLSALLGSILILSADLLARTLFMPRELPVGMVTAALGVPFFFALTVRRVRRYEP